MLVYNWRHNIIILLRTWRRDKSSACKYGSQCSAYCDFSNVLSKIKLWVIFFFFLKTDLPWVLRCSSAFLSTDAAKTVARVNSAPQRQVSATTTTWLSTLVQPQIKPGLFPSQGPLLPLQKQSPACPLPHHGAVTAMEQEAWVGTPRFISPAKPGFLFGTRWTATSTQ